MSWPADAANALWVAFSALLWPAIVFPAIALAAHGFTALNKARAANAEVRTNMILLAVDAVLVAPLLALLVAAVGAWMQAHGLRLFTASVVNAAAMARALHRRVHRRLRRLLAPPPRTHSHPLAHARHPSQRHRDDVDDAVPLPPAQPPHHRAHRHQRARPARAPAYALAANLLVRHYYGMFIHMDLPWTYGPLGRVLVSPAMHRWHHIRDAAGAGANFATVFSVFDQAFRTHHLPGPCNVPLGVRDDIGQSALAQLVWPLRALWRWAKPQLSLKARSARIQY